MKAQKRGTTRRTNRSGRPKRRSASGNGQIPSRAGKARLREAPGNPHRLAREFLRRNGTDEQRRSTLHLWQGNWWAHDRKRYVKLKYEELKAVVTRTVEGLFHEWNFTDTRGHVRQVTRGVVGDVINAMTSVPGVQVPSERSQPCWLGEGKKSPEHIIALQNTLLDISDPLKTGSVQPLEHTPEWFSPICLPYAWNPEAECRQWTKFLHEMFERDQERIDFMQEWFGYCLVADTSQQLFVMIVGPGENGKSVLLGMLKELVGQENCSAVALEDFRDRFALSATIGKLVNIVPDVGDISSLPEGKLKAFVGGDPMSIDRKYLHPLQVKPTARLVFGTNKLPRFHDQSEGVWRRLIVMPADYVVPAKTKDKDLEKKLREESSAIFNWALEGLMRLRRRGHFVIPKRCRVALEAHRGKSDPARAFCLECLREQPDGKFGVSELQRDYQDWSTEREYPMVSLTALGKAIRRVFPNVDARRLGPRDARELVYVGVTGVRGLSSVSQGTNEEVDKGENKEKYSDTNDTASTVDWKAIRDTLDALQGGGR